MPCGLLRLLRDIYRGNCAHSNACYACCMFVYGFGLGGCLPVEYKDVLLSAHASLSFLFILALHV